MSGDIEPLSSTTFLATIPEIQSAIKFGGDGSVRLQLDVPEHQVAGAMPLTIWTRRVLRITVEPVMHNNGEQGDCAGAQMAAWAERQPERGTAKASSPDGALRTRWLKDGTG